MLYILYKCGKKTRSPLRRALGVIGRVPHPYLVFRITWDAEHATRLRRSLEDPCLYATNPLFGADGEGAKFPIESPSVARGRWFGLPEIPNCSVSYVCWQPRFSIRDLIFCSQSRLGTISYGCYLSISPNLCVVFSVGQPSY
jgi:hypothetical protein